MSVLFWMQQCFMHLELKLSPALVQGLLLFNLYCHPHQTLVSPSLHFGSHHHNPSTKELGIVTVNLHCHDHF
ncbi:hypothetical protein CROQUDRAFT_298774 [Cronartium quercuum f. sp. fusiforme G11]|uniref:Uncharacterized protein n=1 Tax=Cronartium quercuum f. sp. fusiforme G11 TaxID=708437 RepID=A0A9P6NBQ2_9BASI|nr:hypothetical protein CROQUDRAFT_298774 [Cronartium quercuum f. sp. fusiforme G11]